MPEPLRVAQVGTIDTVGGAARVAETLQAEFRRAGHACETVVGQTAGGWNGVRSINGSGAARLLERGMVSLGARFGREDFVAVSPYLLPYRDFFRGADIVQLHNLHGGYFNLRALRRIGAAKPTVWTLHDVWAMTGHCAYPGACDSWKSGCGDCPDLTLPPSLKVDATAAEMRLKRRAYARSRFTVVSPSRWLAGLVSQGILSGHRCEVIPNGVDVSIFSPRDRRAAREVLGLPVEGTLVLTEVGESSRPYKGRDLLVEAAGRVAPRAGLTFLALGREPDVDALRRSGHAVHHVRAVSDPRLMALHMAAADLTVTAAVDENHPLQVIESLACGTPVLAFAIGGQPEIIDHGVSGLLVDEVSSGALAAALESALAESGVLSRMGDSARRAALDRFDSRRQAQAYLELYEQLLGRRAEARRAS